MDQTAALYVVFLFAAMVLLCVTGVVLLLVRPSSTAARLWAMYLIVLGVRELTSLQFVVPSWPDGVDYKTSIPQAAFESLTIWSNFALAGFLFVFPRAPRLRSWHTLVFAIGGGAFALGGILYVFAPQTLMVGWERAVVPPPLHYTQAYSWLVRSGVGLWYIPLLISSWLRVRAQPEPTRQASVGFLALASAGAFTTLLLFAGSGLRAMVYDGAPVGSTLITVMRSTFGWGSFFGFVRGVVVTVGLAWLAATSWTRERSPVALALVAYGLLIFLLPPTTLEGFSFNFALACVGTLYVLQRHPAVLGPMPARFRHALPVVTFATMFLLVTSLVLGMLPASFALSAVLAALVGGIAAFFLARMVTRASAAPGSAVDAYRAAVITELAGGSTTEEITTKLRSLRAGLGISESEHALIEYTLRGAGAAAGNAPVALARPLEPGQLFLRRYRIASRLGRGGAGEVLLARDERVQRDVVLKRLRFPTMTPEDVASVLNEARAFAACRHPNVITLYDVEQLGNEALIVMEHAEGGSLAERLRGGPLALSEWTRVALETLAALGAVHEAGLLHRDIKPSNILLTRDGHVKLADFGIARPPGSETTAGRLGDWTEPVGTLRYMSPEVAHGQRPRIASDLYSAAATLFEALDGRPLVDAREAQSEMPEGLRAWFQRALAPEASGRFASAARMGEALEAALADDAAAARPSTSAGRPGSNAPG